MVSRLTIAMIASAVLLAGCAGLRPGWETPTVTVKSVRAVPSQGMLPEFEIDLHIVNPNREALKLVGVSYTVSLEGHELVKGVGNDLPVIEGYGEGDIMLNASADLFAGVGLVRELMASQKDALSYSFEAKLDPGALRPTIRVRDSGTVSLSGVRSSTDARR
jgi:LEA14-like dessication related protein